MSIRSLLDRFAASPTSIKIAITAVVLAWTVALAALIWPVQPGEMPLPEGYTLPDYAQQFDEYRGSPFAPSYARTVNGALIRPAVLAGSESCGSAGCHVQILAEWEPSAHRFAA